MGKFITIYGINNVGKTTQTRLLAERLESEGFKVATLKYPIYTAKPTGPRISSILRENAEPDITQEHFQMLYCLNRFDTQSHLQKLIQENDIVLAEDYTYTSVAWGSAQGAQKDWLITINKHLLEPDFTLMLDGERGVGSIEKGHRHEENHDLASKVQTIFQNLQKELNWTLIHRQEKIEDTHNLMYNEVIKFINNPENE
jgi:dTMP kinase